MKLLSILLAGVSLIAVSSVARAADLIVDEAPMAMASSSSAHDWSGLYVGVSGGYGAAG